MFSRSAKAWVAFILSVLTALQEMYVGNQYLTIACVIVTALGVYLVPNAPDTVPPVADGTTRV